MAKSLISLGANLDRPEVAMVEAARRLKRFSARCSARFSRVYESIAVGGPPDQGIFLNAVALIETDQEVLDLLRTLHQWESELGRTRDVRWGPRNIDLDLLLYEDFVCNSAELTLPHPRMTFRRFVLQPSCDIAAQMVHPIIKKPIGQLLEQLNGEHNFAAVLGGSQEDRASLMAGVQAKLIEQGIEILTGVPAGKRLKSGKYTAGSVFDLADKRLEEIAQGLRRYQDHEEVYTAAKSSHAYLHWWLQNFQMMSFRE